MFSERECETAHLNFLHICHFPSPSPLVPSGSRCVFIHSFVPVCHARMCLTMFATGLSLHGSRNESFHIHHACSLSLFPFLRYIFSVFLFFSVFFFFNYLNLFFFLIFGKKKLILAIFSCLYRFFFFFLRHSIFVWQNKRRSRKIGRSPPY